MDPITVECSSACTVDLVLTFPWQSLTAVDGRQIAASILAIWAVAWACRVLIRMVSESSTTRETEE